MFQSMRCPGRPVFLPQRKHLCVFMFEAGNKQPCASCFCATIQAMTNLGGSVCVFHPKTHFSHLFLNDDLVKLHFSIPNEMELILFLFHSKCLHLKRVHKLEITGKFVEIWF